MWHVVYWNAWESGMQIKINSDKKIIISVNPSEVLIELFEAITINFIAKNNVDDDLNNIKSFVEKKILESGQNNHQFIDSISDLLVELEWLVEEEIFDSPEYVSDQIKSYCHLISAYIFALYNIEELAFVFVDPRDIIQSDDKYKNAELNLEVSVSKWNIRQQSITNNLIVTTHGIACTSDNNGTTLKEEKYWEKIVKV